MGGIPEDLDFAVDSHVQDNVTLLLPGTFDHTEKIGNKILQYFGRYLMDNVTSRGGTYRMDGACFAIMSTVQTTEQLADLYEGIRAHFRKGIKVDDLELSV